MIKVAVQTLMFAGMWALYPSEAWSQVRCFASQIDEQGVGQRAVVLRPSVPEAESTNTRNKLKSYFKSHYGIDANNVLTTCISDPSFENFIHNVDGLPTKIVDSLDEQTSREDVGYRCYIAAFKPSEGNHAGVYPRYVYYSLIVPPTTQVSTFERFVKQRYGSTTNGTPNLNIYKSMCTAQTYHSVDEFVAQVRQDGGVSSVTQIATLWRP